jgi:hypothetical protein
MPRCRSVIFAAVLLAGCSGPELAQTSPSGPAPRKAPEAKTVPAPKEAAVTTSKKCKADNLHRSMCMIELILADLAANYRDTGGGGISQIRALTSTSYSVSLPQEERVDTLTYEFEVKADGTVSLKSKTPSTKSYRR